MRERYLERGKRFPAQNKPQSAKATLASATMVDKRTEGSRIRKAAGGRRD